MFSCTGSSFSKRRAIKYLCVICNVHIGLEYKTIAIQEDAMYNQNADFMLAAYSR